MTPEAAVGLIREALMLTFWLAAPLLVIGLVTGVAISLVQIATSIQDNAVSSIPRVTAFLTGLLLLMPWMVERAMAYTQALFGDFVRYTR